MLNERKLTKTELDKREDIIMNMKGNKRDLVKKYGKDAEAVMYGRATNMAKKQSEGMKDPKLTELIKDALKNPKAADLNKDGKLSDYEEKRGAAIEKNLKESDPSIPLEKDFTYDYEDIGQFYLEGLNKPHSLTDEELGILGKRVVDQLYKGDIGAAYDDIVYKKRGQEKMTEGTWSTGTYTQIERFLYDLNILKDKYFDIVGSDDVFDGLEIAQTAAEEMMVNAPENRGDLEEIGMFHDPRMSSGNFDHLISKEENDEDVVKYKGEDHVITRRDGDRIYLRRKEDAAILGKMPEFWVKSQDINEDIDLGHQDNEPGMLKAELYHIGSYAMELYKMMDDLEGMGEVDFPAWWQSKITTAKNNISGAKHYLEFELKEPAIDAVVDSIKIEEDRKAKEYIQSIEDEDEREEERKRMFDDDEVESIDEITPAQQKYVDKAANKSSKPKKTQFRKDIEAAKRAIDAGRATDSEIIKKYGIEAFNAVDAENIGEDIDADINVNKSGTLGDAAIDRESASGAFEENLDLEAKVDALQRLKRGEIDTLPSDEDAKAALVKRVLGKLSENMSDKEYFLFLNDLRDSGKTNMFGASPYLQDAFGLEKKEAREILTRWMKSFSENIAEGLPKGFWDKKMDAKDEDQDGKVDESYATLVNKLEKQGKGKKAAKAIAGAVASYKAKGGGKGPTTKQK